MSKAGIQSNRGDGYQTLVAFDWALTVLSDPLYEWVEVDSVAWSVDDVVVGKTDGIKICCQCKKNQPSFKAWSVAELTDELYKAGKLLGTDPKAAVRFYSRSGFGELAALREYCHNYADEAAYRVNLGKVQQLTDSNLLSILRKVAPSLSTYEFLRRTTFEISPELDRMETLLHERFRQLASNPTDAFNALWTRLDHLGMRVNSENSRSAAEQHRLTKGDLKALVEKFGAMLTPPMNFVDIRASFQSTSAIGRAWRRDIGGQRISNSLVDDLIAAIAQKHRSILLTGKPGAGKTCAMLALQERLEQLSQASSDMLPVFIQSREFADMPNAHDRQAQGLPENWVEKAARMAETAHVVVVIDSLDVLSISREHSVLTYFLAQVDRLLQVPNITVVTACRDFDRHYDRRIAQRKWDSEFICHPLIWSDDIAPLLEKLSIDQSAIDTATRELIRNPRELALFVQLAQRGGSFNVVTSQALAQRYLATIVRADSALGDVAMQAIEAMAVEMLKLRSLAVPIQRFSTSENIRRLLLSHNVLHETEDGKLAFGHQTLLDVLVISGAVRMAISLNEFIQSLPPVPFVRPSIRSFITQLAAGDRRELRKQLRTVLSGNHAFHIRRLVAECLAELIPQDDDWSLIRDLRSMHRDVFQVIYRQATRVEWHYFWLKHLVPLLKDMRDAEGLTMHVHRASGWKNDDPAGVLTFWIEVLGLECVDKDHIASQLDFLLSDIHVDHSALLTPLLHILLSHPRRPHSSIGRALGRCVTSGGMDDAVLWQYITGDVSEEDVLAFRFDKKLHCESHEFGDSNNRFLIERMQKSIALLDLAVATLESWSQIKRQHYGETSTRFWEGFLRETSYSDSHTQNDHRYAGSERVLFDAIEKAIVNHAIENTVWWQKNCSRLCFSSEGTLRFFTVLACTAAPMTNLGVICRMLRDKVLLESALTFELGTLIKAVFPHISPGDQDAIQESILSIHQDTTTDPKHRSWILHKQAQYIVAIPCHLRSPAAQSVVSASEQEFWPLDRQPDIGMRGGMVRAPFSFEVFLAASDSSVLNLLQHYNGYDRNSFDDFLLGGEREVGWQLREAASRSPARFIRLLAGSRERINDSFCDDIMDGVATYLAHRHGNLQTSDQWVPIEALDDTKLAQSLLDELERNQIYWHHNRAASKAIQSCSHVIETSRDASRIVVLAGGFSTLIAESSVSGDNVDLLTVGINMSKGHIAEALMIVASHLENSNEVRPEYLTPTLRQFATDDHPAVRALVLRHLPYLQSLNAELGWELFGLAMQSSVAGLWAMAEPCLYHAYHQRFEIVGPWLKHLLREGNGKDLETWGRISALAALSKKIDLQTFLTELSFKNESAAWRGAASVWTHLNNAQQHREQCLAGLEAGLSRSNVHAEAVARKFCNLFREATFPLSLPLMLIQRCFELLQTEAEPRRGDVYGFDSWLNATSHRDPEESLSAAELYLQYVRATKHHLFDHENHLTQLLTRLFAQAEEQEESDSGMMLQRVVALQDALLTLGVNGVDEWLKAAERP